MSAAGRASFEDTLRAVARVPREQGLRLRTAHVSAGWVTVFCELPDALAWVEWLSAAADQRMVAWLHDDQVAVHVGGTREDVEWTWCATLPMPAVLPVPLDTTHRVVSLPVVAALLSGGAA